MTMKKLFAIAAISFGMCSAAQACSPPQLGDQFRDNDGAVMELAKPVDRDCFFEKRKICARPVGTKQSCRWVKFPDYQNWIDWP
jgi:hypothetical protein